MRKMRPIVAASLCLLLQAVFAGCRRTSPPTSPDSGVSEGELRFVRLRAPEGGPVLCGSETYVEGEVTPERAATLRLEYESEGLEVGVRLHVRAHAVSEAAIWSLRLHPDLLLTEVGFVFGPAGLEFLRSGMLDIEAEGLDLSGVDPESVGLYRELESGLWELIDPIHLRVWTRGSGNESLVNGVWWIEHFSRYALASR